MIRTAGRRSVAASVRVFAVCVMVAALFSTAEAQQLRSGIRFAHLAADAPLVDVAIDGRAVFLDVGFGDVTGYVPVEPGRHVITVIPHRLRQSASEREGEGGDGSSTLTRVLEPVTALVSIVAGEYHSAVLAGFYEPPAADRQLGHISVSVTPEGTPFQVTGPRGYAAEFTGDQLLTGIEPGTYTLTANREGYRSATYEVDVRPRQTTTVTIALQEGEEETDPEERIVGSVDGSDTWASLQVQTFADEFGGIPRAGEAKIRVVHGSPTSPALNPVAEPTPRGAGEASEGGESDEASETDEAGEAREADTAGALIELGSVAYPAAGPFVALPAGAYALRFRVEGSDRVLVEIEDIQLIGGAVYTFFLASEPDGSRGRIVPTVDASIVWDEAEP